MRRTELKRTPFKSKPPVYPPREEREPLPLRPIRVPAPSSQIHRDTPKSEILRSESYRRFVASHPCFACDAQLISQCCHANEGKGMAMKVSDTETFPLCMFCHIDLDQSRGISRDDRRQQERRYVNRMKKIAQAAGRPEIK
jgi:hypothetical protein